jgi:hypothetical protein
MTDKECEDLGKRIGVLAKQLNKFSWPKYAADELRSIYDDLQDIAAKLCGE